MKTKRIALNTCPISPIFSTCDQDGGGILGFTIQNGDGSFNNVMCLFSAESYELKLAEMEKKRDYNLSKLQKN